MGAENAEAKFALNLEGNPAEFSAEAASELEQLRAKIGASTNAAKQMSSSLRALRGTSDEVKQAKSQLKARIDAERDAISAANLAILKQGTSYEKLETSAKKAAREQAELTARVKADPLKKAKAESDALGRAVKLAGGPVEELSGRFEALKGVLGGAGGAVGAFALAAAATVAAIAAVTAAVIGLGVAFVRFVVGAADAQRSLQLVREAFTGSAQNATNLGTQVDALAGKVATSKDELNGLATQLTRSRLSGQALVDTFNAVGQAGAAMGPEVGKALQDIITRGQLAQRVQINPLELQGTGLRFQDVAGELAEQLHVGVKEAQAALFEGRVKLDDGAKALRKAVEKRFGEINARKLLSLDVQVAKFKERLSSLAKDVKIEPLLRAFDELAKLFDESTVSGATLKQLVTIIGNGIGPAFQAVVPIAKAFFKGLIIGALDAGIAFLKLKKWIVETFSDSKALKGIDTTKTALEAGKVVVEGVAVAFGLVATAAGAMGVAVYALAAPFIQLYKVAKTAYDVVSALPWSGLGKSINDGIANGLTANPATDNAIGALGQRVKDGFTSLLGIHSPSRVFADYGKQTSKGFAEGVQAGAPEAERATAALVASPSARDDAPPEAPRGTGGGGGRGGVNVTIAPGAIVLQIQGGARAADVMSAIDEPSLIAKIQKLFEETLQGAGMPTQAAPTS